MVLHRISKQIDIGTSTTHALARALETGRDSTFRWIRVGRFNLIIDAKARTEDSEDSEN